MNDIRIVEVKNSFTNLIDDIFFMFLLEDISLTDNGMQVDVHVLKNQVYVNIIG